MTYHRADWEKEHPLVLEDLSAIAEDSGIPWESLRGRRILVTGATGLIGSLIVKALLYRAEHFQMPMTIIALSRNRERALRCFAHQRSMVDCGYLRLEQGEVTKPLSDELQADYILHAAAVTSSAEMISNPVGTIMTTVEGTRHVLELARRSSCLACLFFSSMEVYGITENEYVDETESGYLDLSLVRNCYPLSKRVAENLCIAYHAQYQVPVKIARLTLTFGPGIPKNDGRVFAQFARSVLTNKDIVLHTHGTTKRDYLYTADAVRGVLRILLLGKEAEAYNLSDSHSYITIRELAELTRSFNPQVNVVIDVNPEQAKKYAGEVHIRLNNTKIDTLNRFERVPIKEMVGRLIRYLATLPANENQDSGV